MAFFHSICMKKVLIAGGTGLIGQEIIRQLDPKKYQIHILSRSKKENYENVRFFQWDLDIGFIEEGALDVDSIINLAGAGIADKRWTDSRKELLITSRVQSASLIKKILQESNIRPESYISASAIGFYGDSKEVVVSEDDQPADNSFLSVCSVKWENAAYQLQTNVNRLCIIRIGIVLSNEGGAFQKMLLPFKGGLASYFGSGNMLYSWIHIEDIARLFIEAMSSTKFEGIYNGVAPHVVSNKKMIRSIKNNKRGFSILNSVPVFILKAAMGEMSNVVLTSSNVSAAKVAETGFYWNFETIDEAVKDLISN